ncbi:MAG: hypothetical protein WBD97_13730, partial [Pseudolabrys sp.]
MVTPSRATATGDGRRSATFQPPSTTPEPITRRSEWSLAPTLFERKHLGGIEQPIRIERTL